MTRENYEIVGVESSPYSIKVRAVMRYRHLPHTWKLSSACSDASSFMGGAF